MKTSAVEEFRASTKFENILDEEFLKSGAKVKTLMESYYPLLDYHFLEG